MTAVKLRSKKMTLPAALEATTIDLGSGRLASAAELIAGLQSAAPDVVIAILMEVARNGGTDELRLLATLAEITATNSFTADPDRAAHVSAAARSFTLQWWLEHSERRLSRASLTDWWTAFGHLLSVEGVTIQGISRDHTTGPNLWKATRRLAEKIARNLARYGYLQPYNINEPGLVTEALGKIQDPTAWIEVLIGEAWEDLRQCPDLLRAFTTVGQGAGGTELGPEQGAVATVLLALQAAVD